MGNFITSLNSCDKSTNAELEVLSETKNKLYEENNKLKLKIDKLNILLQKYEKQENNIKAENIRKIDDFIEKWYEKNKKDIDIGVITDLPLIGEIDILPDKVEKYMYKRMIHIIIASLEEMNIKLVI